MGCSVKKYEESIEDRYCRVGKRYLAKKILREGEIEKSENDESICE